MLLVLIAAAFLPTQTAFAQPATPAGQAERLRAALLAGQLAAGGDPAAEQALTTAWAAYGGELAQGIAAASPEIDARIRATFAEAEAALAAGDAPAFAAARGRIWTSVLDGAFQAVLAALAAGDGQAARTWLLVREFRLATRFSRPNADATLAVQALVDRGDDPAAEVDYALQAVRADLLDTYQARLNAALRDLATVDAQGFATRRAELAGLAEGYFTLLAPAYAEQRGSAALGAAQQAFDQLRSAAVRGEPVATLLSEAEATLQGFRAAPLSPAEQARRAGQMLRFLSLVPVEYGRGVRNGQVSVDLEIREAITFRDGADAAFSDLRTILDERNPDGADQAEALFRTLGDHLAAAGARTAVAEPAAIRATTDELLTRLGELLPPELSKPDSSADFDVIDAALDQMEQAVAAGEYALAESARLEAYAILESGPEARLIAFAPHYITRIEELFWYGRGDHAGLAYLLESQAARQEIAATRAALDGQLAAAQEALGGQSAPLAIALNASIIVFREGLEAVVILAALMASMVGARRIYRRHMAQGVLLAFAASALTWWLLQTLLAPFRAYGERLEAVVSLVAIAVLLLITNWFFHRVYWTGWMADLHSRKKGLLGGGSVPGRPSGLGAIIAGQGLGFVMLGFTSVYREGFETVLFLQALVLEAGAWSVLQGVALGMIGVLGVGWLTFRLQSRLPYKDMLVVTGVLIGLVLLVMVGNTVHALQIVGWMPLHPIRWLTVPYWLNLWFGVYATWEGLALQTSAALFVLGSYFLAEAMQRTKTGRRGVRSPERPGLKSGLKAQVH
jgi:high-affinity iron transporter